MLKKLKTPILFLCFLLINIAYFDKSDASNNLLKQQTQIIQNQQQINNQQKRKREFEHIKKQRDQLEQNIKDSPSSSSPPQTTKASSSQAPNCFIVKKIALIDANSLSNRQKQQIKSSFLGKCFDGSTLENLTNQLNSLYQEIGLTTTQITIPQQNISTGNLELKIIEGKIADIIFDNDKITDKMQKFTAFGFKKGKILNIGDINQGIYQINRLSSNNAKMRIEPGGQEGTSKIIINNNNKKLPISTKVSYDNLGNDFTGIRRTNISSTIDNLFFLNDQINLSYNQNLDDPSNKKDLRAFSGSISIPFTYNLLSYSHSATKFRGQNASQENQPKILTGNSSSNNISIDRTLLNNTKYTISTNLSLTAKKTASYLNKQKLETSDRKLTIGSLSFAISRYFKNGTTVYLKPQYNAGLKFLDAKQDQQGLADDIPKAQFQIFKLYASISKRFQIPKINAPITLSTQIDSQISKDTLFGSEQFSVGGYYSVRGFRENNINGDHGYYFRNKASFNLGQILVPILTKKEGDKKDDSFMAKNSHHLYKINMEPFYDYGYAKTKYNSQGQINSGRLSGAGIKTIFSSKYFDASVSYSWAISKSSLIEGEDKENKMLYFELGVKCC